MTSPQPVAQHGMSALAAYGALRAPLALLELPLFVLLPAFYAAHGGIGIAAIGAILLVTRLADACFDPVIGAMMDRAGPAAKWRRWILATLPVLVVGFAAIFAPPAGPFAGWWLALFSIIVYAAYSIVSIAYQAWGATLGTTARDRVRVTATREAFGLGGVVLSAGFMTTTSAGPLSIAFALTALVAGVALLRAPMPVAAVCATTPAPATTQAAEGTSAGGGAGARAADAAGEYRSTLAWSAIKAAFVDPDFRWLIAAFAASGIATAIPATLVLFFIADVLDAGNIAPRFLLLYFLCAALAMPFWTRVAARIGLRNAWIAGIGLSVVGFVWALGLGRGDTTAFGLICIITGIALAADLAMPPALLAALIDRDGSTLRRATSFGVWNLVTKLNLALAAGIGLPLLSLLGYLPSSIPGGVVDAARSIPGQGATALPLLTEAAGSLPGALALTLVYAGLPCLLKLVAAFLLVVAPLSASEDAPALLAADPTARER